MRTVKITAKRQATLPAALCDELGIGAGDRITVDRRVIGDRPTWVIQGRTLDWSWFGAAAARARAKSHRWRNVRRDIELGWARDRRA